MLETWGHSDGLEDSNGSIPTEGTRGDFERVSFSVHQLGELVGEVVDVGVNIFDGVLY